MISSETWSLKEAAASVYSRGNPSPTVVQLNCAGLYICCMHVVYGVVHNTYTFVFQFEMLEQTRLETTMSKFSKVRQQAERTGQQPTADETHELSVLYGFTQKSRLFSRGGRSMSP